MKSCKQIISLFLIFLMVTGLALTGHAVGHVIRGSVVSYGDAAAQIVLQLTPEGDTTTVIQETVTGNTATYQLSPISSGSYTLTVQKEGHVTRSYPVTIDGADTVLDLKICLQGDANCNGKINTGDVSVTYAHSKGTAPITDRYKLACADWNGDGRVNLGDTSRIYAISKGTYTPPVKEVTLSVWAPYNDIDGDNSWLTQMEASFQKAHPEYKITWENEVCHEGDAGTLAAENPEDAADVYMIANDQIGMLINAGAIQELQGKYADQVLSDNAQTMVNTVTYTDGNIYAFPMTNNTWFMYYNKNTYTEEDIKSLDTMLTKGNVAFPWNTAWYSGTFFLANGGTLFGDKGIDASAGIQFGKNHGGYEAALKMVQLASNLHFINDVDGRGYRGFTDGSVDAFFSGSWDYEVLQDALGDALGIAPLPSVEIGGVQKQMKAFAGSKAVAVNPHTENQALATAFAAYLATPEAQKLRYECNRTVPAAASLINDPVIGQNPVALAEINTIANASTVQPIIPEMGSYWIPVGNFGQMIANGEVNESNYQKAVDRLMSDLNMYGFDDNGGETVVISVWTPYEDQVLGGWLETMQESFAAAHPEINIIWENSACHEADAYTLISNDPINAADVYMFPSDQLHSLVDIGAIYKLSGDHLTQIMNDFSQTSVNTVTHSDGSIYGFPMANNTWFMYYNKEIFSEEDVKSLDTMLSKGSVAFPLTVSWYGGSFFLANGGTVFGEKGNDPAAGIQFGKNNGGFEAALKMVQLAKNPNFVNDESGIGNAGLMNGTVGAYFSGSWDYNSLYNQMGDKLGAAQLPTVEIDGVQKQMKAFAGSKAIAVNPNSEQLELAADFAAYLASPESQKLRYQHCNVIPAAASLADDPEIAQNPVAVAEINTMNYASVVQPSISEMGNYWSPMSVFSEAIVNHTITEDNYQEYVNHLMSNFGNIEDPNSTYQIANIHSSTDAIAGHITLRFHYHRPDGNYNGWNLWIWNDSVTQIEPPYQFEWIDNEMVCTVTLPSGTDYVGYIVRLNNWDKKDVDEDQFIDLANILTGTVDVYIESGVYGHQVVLQDDVIIGTTLLSLDYAHNNQQLVLGLSSLPPEDLTVTLTNSNGNITISKITRVGDYYYLTLAQSLTPDSYTLDTDLFTVTFDII